MNLSRSVEILCLVILPVISYFIGNISPATLVGRLYGVDIRKEGSGNPGTTNVLRTLGKKGGCRHTSRRRSQRIEGRCPKR